MNLSERRVRNARGWFLSPVAAVLFGCFTLGGAFAQAVGTRGSQDMNTKILYEFHLASELWSNIDDAVMGGVSSSRMRMEHSFAVFEGEISLENNGGFASVRSRPLEVDLAGFDGVRLHVRGDGKSYQLRIRTSGEFDGPSSRVTFATSAGEWSEIEFAFSEFVAAFRGRPLPDYPKLEPGKIVTFGLLIADEQAGPFRLDIKAIEAFRGDPKFGALDGIGTK